MRILKNIKHPASFHWLKNDSDTGWVESNQQRVFSGTQVQIKHGNILWLYTQDETRENAQAFVVTDEQVAFFQYQFATNARNGFEQECIDSLTNKLKERNSGEDEAYPILVHQSAVYAWEDSHRALSYAELPDRTVFRTYWNGKASFITIEGSPAEEGGRTLHKWRNKTVIGSGELPQIVKQIEGDLFKEKCVRESPGGLADNWEYTTGGCLKSFFVGTVCISSALGGVAYFLA